VIREEFRFFSRDEVELYGAVCRPDRFRGLVVVFAHGIPSGKPAAPGDGGYIELCERAAELGYVGAMMNFRGTGQSGGNFDISAWVDDMRAFLDILWRLAEPKGVVLVGSSGGAAVAVRVASEDERVVGLGLLACPADFSFLAPWDAPREFIEHFRGIGIIRDAEFPDDPRLWAEGFRELAPEKYIGLLKIPILLIHGTDDEVVPFEHAQRLDGASETAKMIGLSKMGHRLREYPTVKTLLFEWLRGIIVRSAKEDD